jgi:hypothetical protein
MNITLFVALAAIFYLAVRYVVKNRNSTHRLLKGERSNIRLYYVKIAMGLWCRFVSFLKQIGTRQGIQKNKCEAAGGLF